MGMENIEKKKKEKRGAPKGSRLWSANEIRLRLSVKEIKVSGKDNIKEIPPGAKVVVMTTHLTDLDEVLAIHAVGQDLDIVVTNESVHHKFFGRQGEAPLNVAIRIAGKKNFIPIDWKREESGKKSAKGFNPENFVPMVQAMEKGKSVVIAAHNPSAEPLPNLDNVRGGYGGVYLAEITDAYILPVTVSLDHPAGMYGKNVQTFLNKPNASVIIGKPFKLEKIEGIDRFAGLAKQKEGWVEFVKLADALRKQSQAVIERMSGQMSAQK